MDSDLLLEIVYRYTGDPAVHLLLREGLNKHLQSHLLPKPFIQSWYHLELVRDAYFAWRNFVREAHPRRVNSWHRRLHRENDAVAPFLVIEV